MDQYLLNEKSDKTELLNYEKVYPISEIFVSPQGEGVYQGTMMTFIRLAGCTVGKPFPKEMYVPSQKIRPDKSIQNKPAEFPIYTEKCTLYDGREFACDTDYRVKERLMVEKLLNFFQKMFNEYALLVGNL